MQVAPREGIDFAIVKPTQPTSNPVGETEVIEFFGYWCPRCFEFEPTMSDWATRNDAKAATGYVPIADASSQSGLQKMYYALDAMGKERALRRKVFNAIHKDHSLSPTPDTGAMATWAEKNGLDKEICG